MKNVFDRVVHVVSEELGVDKNIVTRETNFVETLGADSIDRLELGMGIEEEFDTDIPDNDINALHTVEDYVKYLEKHI